MLKKPKGHLTNFDALPDGAFIRESELIRSAKNPNHPGPLPFSAPTLWRKVKAGTFPKPIKLSERVTCWKVGTVRAWMAAQGSQSYNPAVIAKKRIKGIELATA